MKTVSMICVLFIALSFMGCGKSEVDQRYPALIKQAGTLESKDGTLLAKVETTDAIVHITILEKKTAKVLLKAKSGNTYHRWYLGWDKDNRLWNWNSDIGGDVFELKDGKWIRNKTPDYGEAPKVFIDNLPSSVKRTLK